MTINRQIVITDHSVWDRIEVFLASQGLRLFPMPEFVDDLPTWGVTFIQREDT